MVGFALRGAEAPLSHQRQKQRAEPALSVSKGVPAPHKPLTSEVRRPGSALCSLAPARQILFLLGREAVDFDPHGFQFQLGDALVEFVGDAVDALL